MPQKSHVMIAISNNNKAVMPYIYESQKHQKSPRRTNWGY